MPNWEVTYADRTEIIPACSYVEARDIAAARACRGRAPYPTRAEALAADPDAPALPCGDHWHVSHAPRQTRAQRRRATPGRRTRDNEMRRKRRRASLWGACHESYDDLAIAERDLWHCALCGEPIDPDLPRQHPRGLNIAHNVALAYGGDDAPDNVFAAHHACNARQGTRDLIDYWNCNA